MRVLVQVFLAISTCCVIKADSFSSVDSNNVRKGAAGDASSLKDVSLWSDLEPGPPDAILGIAQAFRASTDPRKVNICVGAYRDAHGKPWVLPTVQEAEKRILEQQATGAANKEYLPIEGDADFINAALAFAYGTDQDLDKVAGVQTLSGTGACRIGGHFLAQFLPGRTIYIPTPTWTNHWKIFFNCGLETAPYRYYNSATNALDIDGLLEDLETAPDGSIILLHACAHNPTGCDPSNAQWEKIAKVLLRKHHVCFFDSAYQGFASGDSEKDAWALRYVVSTDVPVLLAQSFAKNFGLYGERCGTLSVVCANAREKETILSQLRCIIRPMYSSPPRHGSSIVKTILTDSALTKQYYSECAQMAHRINSMRTKLVEELLRAGSMHDWSHITQQIGMFAYTGMNAEMVDELTAKKEIYMTRDGRISLAGLNDDNLVYVAEAIHAVTDGKRITTE